MHSIFVQQSYSDFLRFRIDVLKKCYGDKHEKVIQAYDELVALFPCHYSCIAETALYYEKCHLLDKAKQLFYSYATMKVINGNEKITGCYLWSGCKRMIRSCYNYMRLYFFVKSPVGATNADEAIENMQQVIAQMDRV